jgi:bifunctional non-homologous end joining protein LigD
MFAFDLLFLDGEDLRRLPLIERRESLRVLLPKDRRHPIQCNDHYDGSGAALFTKACAMGLVGFFAGLAGFVFRRG